VDVPHPSSPPGGRPWESSEAGRSRRPGRAINRSGLVLIFSALGIFPPLASCVKREEKLSKARIGVSQPPRDVAECPPLAHAQAHREVRERAAQRGGSLRSPGIRRRRASLSVVADVTVASRTRIGGTLTRSPAYAITIHLVARSGIAPTG
jgi:hypothetical protein